MSSIDSFINGYSDRFMNTIISESGKTIFGNWNQDLPKQHSQTEYFKPYAQSIESRNYHCQRMSKKGKIFREDYNKEQDIQVCFKTILALYYTNTYFHYMSYVQSFFLGYRFIKLIYEKINLQGKIGKIDIDTKNIFWQHGILLSKALAVYALDDICLPKVFNVSVLRLFAMGYVIRNPTNARYWFNRFQELWCWDYPPLSKRNIEKLSAKKLFEEFRFGRYNLSSFFGLAPDNIQKINRD